MQAGQKTIFWYYKTLYMKLKCTLSVSLFGLSLFGISAFGQILSQPTLPPNIANRTATSSIVNDHIIAPEATGAFNQPKSLMQSVGTSTYQMQSNGSVQNHIVRNSDNTISVGFMYSSQANFGDRGTGYAYFNGTSWSPAPTARIEPVRTGFPSMLVLGNNSEVIVSHNTEASNLHFSKRATKGTGNWTHSSTALASNAPEGNYWPRAIVGGNNNQSIHVISISNPVDLQSNPVTYMGQRGALTYSRSEDGGTTWNILHQINADHDSSHYRGFSAEDYAIDAKGNTVAYVVGGFRNDLFLMKSTDNGTNWTKTVISQFPIPFFDDMLSDINNDGIADTLNTDDGTLALLIDDNNMVHVWFGNMRVMDDNPGDGSISFFPGTNGLSYWNDGMATGTAVTIAGAEDLDGNGQLDITAWGRYETSLSSMPTAGIDANGKIYLTYSAVVENTDGGDDKAYRNVYLMTSEDHGQNWSLPVRINESEVAEQTFPSIVRNVNPDCIQILYVEDVLPGHGVGANNPDPANIGQSADMIYACYNYSYNSVETVKLNAKLDIYPNPTKDVITISSNYNMDKVEVYNMLGVCVATLNLNNMQTSIDVSQLKNGTYMVRISCDEKNMVKMFVKE